MSDELKMTFDPMTIEHLGVRMYSTLPPVLAELIANSADADATKAIVHLNDNGNKEIVVEDNGEGMTLKELNEKFLRIGRNRREATSSTVSTKGRKVIGKKGLGKLSFFGIADEIEVVTRKDGLENSFLLRWEDIKKAGADKEDYKPKPLHLEAPCNPGLKGTTITLRGLKRKTGFDAEKIAVSLSKIFVIEPSFTILVLHNGTSTTPITNEMRYENLEKEIEWTVPGDIGKGGEYLAKMGITGHIMSARKPIPPSTKMRGISLYSRKKLVNNPEFFSETISSHFFSYLTGWLEVDFIDDDIAEDVISTDRQSLNWEHPEMAELRENLRVVLGWMERDWRRRRSENREKDMKTKTGIDVPNWFSKLPQEIKESISPILEALLKESELPPETINDAAKKLHEVIPEYPLFHWRHLHPIVQTTSKPYYERTDYYTAFMESVKRYVNAVKAKAKSTLTDHALLENIWSERSPKLSVTSKFKKPDGGDFTADTIKNIGGGHRMLVLGIWSACRCPIAHEEVVDLRESGLFTEKDCLDALGLVSHLFYRLDNAEVTP